MKMNDDSLCNVPPKFEKIGWRVHAWVFMANHYHLFIETPDANPVEDMKWLRLVWKGAWIAERLGTRSAANVSLALHRKLRMNAEGP